MGPFPDDEQQGVLLPAEDGRHGLDKILHSLLVAQSSDKEDDLFSPKGFGLSAPARPEKGCVDAHGDDAHFLPDMGESPQELVSCRFAVHGDDVCLARGKALQFLQEDILNGKKVAAVDGYDERLFRESLEERSDHALRQHPVRMDDLGILLPDEA